MRSVKYLNCKVLLQEYHNDKAHNQELVSVFKILYLCQDMLHLEKLEFLLMLSRSFGQPQNTDGM